MSNEKTKVIAKFKKHGIPNLNEWSWEQLATLEVMSSRIWAGIIPTVEDEDNLVPILTKNFKCSVSELRSAIATQITCAEWSEGTDQVQHFATFMFAGLQPESRYTERATELLKQFIDFVKLNPEHYESDEIQRLEGAISFLQRFK